MDELVSIGRVTAPHGVRGEVRVLPLTDFPERFRVVQRLFVRRPRAQAPEERRVEQVRFHKQFVIVKLEGIDTRNDAETLRRALLQVAPDEVYPLPEGYYYVFQIVGLRVFDQDGRELGVVDDVWFTGANDVYVVKASDGREILLPAVREFILRIDLESGRMDVRLLPGLE
ncbi:MAG: ribosome maturation factor RimM [Limnochordales bacterium]|nr:16S rRNA processing protein RimM [Bacillota bacterium]